MKIKLIVSGIIFILVFISLSGCNEINNNSTENGDMSPQITESFNINNSYPYRYWPAELSKGTKIRVKATLDVLPDGEVPIADFIFFDGNTNDRYDQLSSLNSTSIDKTWVIPYDGMFFIGVENRQFYELLTGNITVYW